MNIKYVSKCDKFKLDYQRHASLGSHIIKDEANKNQAIEIPIFYFSLRRGSGGCNSRDSSGYTALHYAALNGHL